MKSINDLVAENIMGWKRITYRKHLEKDWPNFLTEFDWREDELDNHPDCWVDSENLWRGDCDPYFDEMGHWGFGPCEDERDFLKTLKELNRKFGIWINIDITPAGGVFSRAYYPGDMEGIVSSIVGNLDNFKEVILKSVLVKLGVDIYAE